MRETAAGDVWSSLAGAQTHSKRPELQLRPRKIEFDYDQIYDTNGILREEYNLYLPFVQDLPAGDKPRVAAIKIHERVDTVQRIWDEAAAKTRKLLAPLGIELEEYSRQRRARLHWWKEGNVFSTSLVRQLLIAFADLALALPLKEIIEAFEDQEPPAAESLLKYIRSALLEELPALQDEGQDVDDNESWDEDLVVHDSLRLDGQVEKYMWLIQHLSELPQGRRYATHAYAFYVTHFLRHTYISSYAYNDALKGLKETLALDKSRMNETETFLDLASLHRELDDALRSTPLKEWRIYRCREASMEFLEFLQRKAKEEVRAKVIPIGAAVLPAELTEQIVECALLAEGLSNDDKVRSP